MSRRYPALKIEAMSLLNSYQTVKGIVAWAMEHMQNGPVLINIKKLELLFLHPYSPELNQIERVWGHLRYLVTHNTYFENLKALENAVAEYLKGHFELNKRPAFLCRIK